LEKPRRLMEASLQPLVAMRSITLPIRRLEASDAGALAALMLDAYRGTIDDEGESLEGASTEVARVFEAEMIWPASFCVPSPDASEGLLCASLVMLHKGKPLLAFTMTAARAKRRGLARSLIVESMHALTDLGFDKLLLVVTRGNTPAEELYESLGFVDVTPEA
jgi:hypothetical protein